MFAVDLSKALRYSGTLVPFVLHEPSCYVDSARNKLVKTFLETDATHLMMVDVDVSFGADAFLKTFSIMEAHGLELLYGNYALGNSGNSIFGPPENAAQEAAVMVNLKPNTLYLNVATGGTGWAMIRRSLLERMQKECPGPWPWFARDLTADGSDRRGEDITFGLRAFGLDPKPKIGGTTAVLLRHLKTQPFIPEFMNAEAGREGLAALSFPNPYESDPKFMTYKNSVILKENLSEDMIQALKEEEKAQEVFDAMGRGDGEVQGGEAAQRLQDRPEGEQSAESFVIRATS